MEEQVGVVIIGAGAGGGAVAWGLTAQSGIPVVLLDAGPKFNPYQDYGSHLEQWESHGFPEKPGSLGRYVFAEMQELDEQWKHLLSWNRVTGRYNPSSRRGVSGPGYHHVRGVGGSTLHFTGESHRLNPYSMQMKSRLDVAADWPLTYKDLEADYVTAEKIVGVAGPDENGDRWRSAAFPLPPHPLSPASKRIGVGMKALGWTWGPNARAALSLPYDGRPDCNYCGQCTQGCPRVDKGSADVTFIRKALETGLCDLRPGCQVTALESDSGSSVKRIRYRDEQGDEQLIAASVVVLAAGAVETPRLLLASAGKSAKKGVANASGQVGKNLMETISWSCSALIEDDVQSYAGLPADAICWDFNRPDAIPGVIGGCRFSAAVHEAELAGSIAYARRVVPGWGKAHKEAMRKAVGRVITVGAIGESLPSSGTFVDLDSEQKDQFGMPLARIHSELSEGELKRLSFMAESCRKVVKASGGNELVEEYGSYDYFSATHIFGTCRMGDDPGQSVVNADCQSHDWKNLFITDASVFPSSGGGESPSLTIQALALRAARAISRQLGADKS